MVNYSGGYLRSEIGTMEKIEYKQFTAEKVHNKLTYPIAQNVISHLFVALIGFFIGLISSGKLNSIIQTIFQK